MQECNIYLNASSNITKGDIALWVVNKDDSASPPVKTSRAISRKMRFTSGALGKHSICFQVLVPIRGLSEQQYIEAFRRLKENWLSDVEHLSSLDEICMHSAYQRIIGMGQKAVPLILAELEREPNFWFWALSAITGDNPILEEQRGNVREMTESWLQWGRKNGYLNGQIQD